MTYERSESEPSDDDLDGFLAEARSALLSDVRANTSPSHVLVAVMDVTVPRPGLRSVLEQIVLRTQVRALSRHLAEVMVLLDGEIWVLEQIAELLDAHRRHPRDRPASCDSLIATPATEQGWSTRAGAMYEGLAFLDVIGGGRPLLDACGRSLRQVVARLRIRAPMSSGDDDAVGSFVTKALELVDAVAWARIRRLNHVGALPLATNIDRVVRRTGTVVVAGGDDHLRIAEVLQEVLPGLSAEIPPRPCARITRSSMNGLGRYAGVVAEIAWNARVAEARVSHVEHRLERWRKALDLVPLDVSGADLSRMDLHERSALHGVVWTETTTWPSHDEEWVRACSRDLGAGSYQIVGDEYLDLERAVTFR
ncbi:hypothetical protein [Streptomyces sp. SID3343]|uniref:hypothetical protein n=1 Tax=Streptomyces sp. SID3343 TaxID=2690260 RepID=UPI00136D8CCF|nr:hypothetical protein [Streptomyces sp. SID3343]MYV97003.1 hypothetical protein [Streptomyces sp. SID3343]